MTTECKAKIANKVALEVSNLCFSFAEHRVLKDFSLSAGSGELVAFLGPNGVGKTTLFRCLLGFLQPSGGSILINGAPISDYSRKELAGFVAYIPQSFSPAFNHTVLDCVLMGVTNRLGLFEPPSEEHRKRALGILETLGIGNLARRGVMNISGGERQLVLVARALIQDAGLIIMDEPTSSLDYGNGVRVMRIVSKLAENGYSVFFSTHDPNMAMSFAHRIVGMKDGRVLADCKPADVSPEILSELYSVGVSVCPECNSVFVKS